MYTRTKHRYMLTLENIQDHPDMKTWTIERGRLECFRAVRSEMEDALNLSPTANDGFIPRGQLLHLLAQASTLKMETLWRGRDELPDEFMSDLIFRVKLYLFDRFYILVLYNP